MEIYTGSDPLAQRAAAILQQRIEERCGAAVFAAGSGADATTITLDISAGLGENGFRIADAPGGVSILGNDALGLLHGIGKFLRTSRYADGAFTPGAWRGTSVPSSQIRGMYYASHFHNWYHTATEPELVRYTEDMALWGVNAVMAVYPMMNLQDWDDPEAAPALTLLRAYARATRELGLHFVLGTGNTMFEGTPENLLAVPLPDPTGRRGNSGRPVCPSNPEGHRYILDNFRRLLQGMADVGVDMLLCWPYDEGGCACEKCLPWGSNGYLKLSRDMAAAAREYFPQLKTGISTWMFDTPPEGEWDGLARELNRGNDWLDFILADAHENFPSYPLHHPIPGGLPLVNFPEISMWGLYPWGGFGATPLPHRFEQLWQQVKHVVNGGFPYSEGIYEDINKAIVVQFYWERERNAEETLREYIAYEYSPTVTDDVLQVIRLLETVHTQAALRDARNGLQWHRDAGHQPELIAETEAVVHLIETTLRDMGAPLELNLDAAHEAHRLAGAIDAKLPTWAARGWRWRILLLRTMLEPCRHVPNGLNSPEAKSAMKELIELFHCRLIDDGKDPYHCRVRPPLNSEQ